jgi:dUTP pyrophosphatase
MTKPTLASLEARLAALENQNKLSDIYTIKIQELEAGYAPVTAHDTDAGHDLKIRPTETNETLYEKLKMYINPSGVGKSFDELPILHIDGRSINWYEVGASNRYDFITGLIQHYQKNPAICLGEYTDKKTCQMKVGVGFKIQLPEIYKVTGWTVSMLLTSRSGLSFSGIKVLNSPGVIDAEYRGEVQVALENTRPGIHIFSKGVKIAQALIVPCISLSNQNTVLVDSLDDTERGSSGFGSTGI